MRRICESPPPTPTHTPGLALTLRLWAALEDKRAHDLLICPGPCFPTGGKTRAAQVTLVPEFRFLMATRSCFGGTALAEK